MTKEQQKILSASEAIFQDSKSRVNLAYRKKGSLVFFDLQIDGVVLRSFTTRTASAFVEGYFVRARSHEGCHEIMPDKIFKNPVLCEENLK